MSLSNAGERNQFLQIPRGANCISNQQTKLMTDLETIISIERVPSSSKRYDISVEGNQNFFANGVLVHNCQNIVRDIFEKYKDDTYEVSVKLDGSSETIYSYPDEEEEKGFRIGVCSRKMDLKEEAGNSFWAAARNQKIVEAMEALYEATGRMLALQGELMGPKVQTNQEKLEKVRFFLFKIYDIQAAQFLNPVERATVLEQLRGYGADLDSVPIFAEDFKIDIEAGLQGLLDLADGPSLNPDVKREGLVFKSHQHPDFSFKAISNSWLLKKKD